MKSCSIRAKMQFSCCQSLWKQKISLYCLAMLDMLICIPLVRYIILADFTEENWREQHRELSMSISVHIVLSALLGMMTAVIMWVKVGVQIGIITATRLYSAALLLELNQDTSYEHKFVIWLTTTFIIAFVIAQAPTAVVYCEKGLQEKDDFCKSLAKTLFPAGVITGISCLTMYFFGNAEFNLLYYAVSLFGLEVMVASWYFCIVDNMIVAKDDHATKNISTENGIEVKAILRNTDTKHPIRSV